jgi:hypothetical protein
MVKAAANRLSIAEALDQARNVEDVETRWRRVHDVLGTKTGSERSAHRPDPKVFDGSTRGHFIARTYDADEKPTGYSFSLEYRIAAALEELCGSEFQKGVNGLEAEAFLPKDGAQWQQFLDMRTHCFASVTEHDLQSDERATQASFDRKIQALKEAGIGCVSFYDGEAKSSPSGECGPLVTIPEVLIVDITQDGFFEKLEAALTAKRLKAAEESGAIKGPVTTQALRERIQQEVAQDMWGDLAKEKSK